MSLQATRVLEDHIAQCFLRPHPPSLRCWMLTSVRGRLLSKLGFAPTQESQRYVLMIANSYRPLLFKAALSQVDGYEETTGQP